MSAARGMILGVALLIAACLVALPRFQPYRGAGVLEGTRESRAFRIGQEPVGFLIQDSSALVRILVNPSLTQSDQPFQSYVLRVDLPDEGRIERFDLLARTPAQNELENEVFVIGGSGRVGNTRELFIDRAGARMGTMLVSVEGVPWAAVRVLTEHERIVAGPGSVQADGAANALPIWSRVSAAPGTPLVRLYFRGLGLKPPRAEDDPVLEAGQVDGDDDTSTELISMMTALTPEVAARYSLNGGGAELRLLARAFAGREVNLSWAIVDGHGARRDEGTVNLVTDQDEGVVSASGTALAKSVRRFVWPRTGDAFLELSADGPAWAQLARVAMDEATVGGMPRWVPLVPHGAKVEAVHRPALTPSPGVSADGALKTIVPSGDPLRLQMASGAAKADLASLWPLSPGREASVDVRPRPDLAMPSHADMTIWWSKPSTDAAENLTVLLDGYRIESQPLVGLSGRVFLPPVRVGGHKLKVEAPSSVELLVDHPVSGSAGLRRIDAYELPNNESLEVTVGQGPARLWMVAYSESRPMNEVSIHASLVERSESSTTLSSDHTRTGRRWLTKWAPSMGRCLGRSCASLHESRPMAMRLGDDLGASNRKVRVRMSGEARSFLRFYREDLARPVEVRP